MPIVFAFLHLFTIMCSKQLSKSNFPVSYFTAVSGQQCPTSSLRPEVRADIGYI